MNITRVLLIDDHPIVRKGLKMMIEREPDLTVCGEANGMSQGMKLCFESSPDVVVSDISLQNGSGIELVKELVARDDQLHGTDVSRSPVGAGKLVPLKENARP